MGPRPVICRKRQINYFQFEYHLKQALTRVHFKSLCKQTFVSDIFQRIFPQTTGGFRMGPRPVIYRYRQINYFQIEYHLHLAPTLVHWKSMCKRTLVSEIIQIRFPQTSGRFRMGPRHVRYHKRQINYFQVEYHLHLALTQVHLKSL